MFTFRPSTYPLLRSPRLNAATVSRALSILPAVRYPTTGVAVCCAHTAAGHAAALPNPAMNSRKLFEINRCFRNEGLSPRHNPEFTSLELYQAYVDFTSMIDLTEAIVYEVAMRLHGMPKVKFTDKELDFTPPWPRKGMVDLIREDTGLDLYAHQDAAESRDAANAVVSRQNRA
jgi:tRNA synthetases class II (D, K and N)